MARSTATGRRSVAPLSAPPGGAGQRRRPAAGRRARAARASGARRSLLGRLLRATALWSAVAGLWAVVAVAGLLVLYGLDVDAVEGHREAVVGVGLLGP